jgi:hypothetical protein
VLRAPSVASNSPKFGLDYHRDKNGVFLLVLNRGPEVALTSRYKNKYTVYYTHSICRRHRGLARPGGPLEEAAFLRPCSALAGIAEGTREFLMISYVRPAGLTGNVQKVHACFACASADCIKSHLQKTCYLCRQSAKAQAKKTWNL